MNGLVLFVMFPYLSLGLFYLAFWLLTKKRGTSMRLALDLSTIVVLYAIHVALVALTGRSHLGWLIIAVLLVFPLNAIWQRARALEVDYREMLRHSWRIVFLIALPVQLILLGIGIRQLFIS